MLLGNAGPIGKFAFTERAGGVTIAAVLAISGVGATSFVLHSFAASVYSSAGAGAFTPVLQGIAASVYNSAGAGAMSPVLHSFDGAVFASAGIGAANFPGSRIDNRVLSIAGTSTFQSFTYSFFIDAEVACVHEEPRAYNVQVEYRIATVEFDPNRHPDAIVATIPPENRTAIVPFENRVYQVGAEPRGAPTPNRKRMC